MILGRLHDFKNGPYQHYGLKTAMFCHMLKTVNCWISNPYSAHKVKICTNALLIGNDKVDRNVRRRKMACLALYKASRTVSYI